MASIHTKGFVVALGWLVACGGTTASVGDGDGGGGGGVNDSGVGNSDGGGGSDGGSSSDSGGGGSPACPPTAPTGGACPVNGAVCEYGDDPNEACNEIVLCQNGQWSFPPRGGCPGPGGMCAATYGDVPVDKVCTPEFETCDYPEGTCICTRNGGGPPRLDPGWSCTPLGQGCPSPRPRVGSACSKSQAGLDCNYGACSGGDELSCKNGYWQSTPVPCPL